MCVVCMNFLVLLNPLLEWQSHQQNVLHSLSLEFETFDLRDALSPGHGGHFKGMLFVQFIPTIETRE